MPRSTADLLSQYMLKAAPTVEKRSSAAGTKVPCRIVKVNYVNRRVLVAARGFSGPKRVPVAPHVKLGTKRRKQAFKGDQAVLELQGDRWICVAIRHTTACMVTEKPGVEVDIDVGDDIDIPLDDGDEVDIPTSVGFDFSDFSTLITPDYTFPPPVELLGDISLPEMTLDTHLHCGLPSCTDCYPNGLSVGMKMQVATDDAHPGGCWVWDFDLGVIGGTVFFVIPGDPGEYARIDSFISSSITPGTKFFRLGAVQDSLVAFAAEIEYAGDGVTFSVVETIGAGEFVKPILDGNQPVNFGADLSNRSYQYMATYHPATESEFATPKPEISQAIYDQWTPATGDGKPISLFSTETDFFVSGEGEVFIYISTNGGASFTKYSLGFLLELYPSRLYGGVNTVTQEDWETPPFGDPGCCTYLSEDCVVEIAQQIPRKTYIFDTSNDVIYFAMCPPQLGVDPWLPGTDVINSFVPDLRGFLGVAPKSDGNGCYVVAELAFEAQTTDTGASVSPYAPVTGIFSNYDFGNVREQRELLVWNVLNNGTSSFQAITLGIFGVGDPIRHPLAAITNIADPDEVYIMMYYDDEFFVQQTAVYLYDWTANTLTDLVAPFTDLVRVSTLRADAGANVSKSGSYFQAMYDSDFTISTLFRYKAGVWTSLDLSTELFDIQVAVSYLDDTVYLMGYRPGFATAALGVSTDDGDTWVFTDVVGAIGYWPDAY